MYDSIGLFKFWISNFKSRIWHFGFCILNLESQMIVLGFRTIVFSEIHKMKLWHLFTMKVTLKSDWMAFFFGHSIISFTLDNFGRRTTYHVSEFVHPESVAPSTIISLHIVFCDFINILKPNQLPENLFTHKNGREQVKLGHFYSALGHYQRIPTIV